METPSMAFTSVTVDTCAQLLVKEWGAGMSSWEINWIRFGSAGLLMLLVSLGLQLRDYMIWRRRWFRNNANDGKENQDPTEYLDDIEQDIVAENVKKDTVGSTTNGNPMSTPSSSWYAFPKQQSKSAWLWVTFGVFSLTFASETLFNYALFQLPMAFALSIASIGPLYAMPIAYLIKKEKPTNKACAGAVFAVSGIVLLSFTKNQV